MVVKVGIERAAESLDEGHRPGARPGGRVRAVSAQFTFNRARHDPQHRPGKDRVGVKMGST